MKHLLKSFFGWFWKSDAPEHESDDSEGVWCVVANIRREHSFGPNGEEARSGTRQFRGGTKVYIPSCFPGMCESVVCIGLHRKSRRFIECVVDVRWVENFRAKVVYHPKVLARIDEQGGNCLGSKEEVKRWAATFARWHRARMNRGV